MSVRALLGLNGSNVYAPLRSAQSEVPRTSCAVSRLILKAKIVQIRLK